MARAIMVTFIHAFTAAAAAFMPPSIIEAASGLGMELIRRVGWCLEWRCATWAIRQDCELVSGPMITLLYIPFAESKAYKSIPLLIRTIIILKLE